MTLVTFPIQLFFFSFHENNDKTSAHKYELQIIFGKQRYTFWPEDRFCTVTGNHWTKLAYFEYVKVFFLFCLWKKTVYQIECSSQTLKLSS